MSGLFPVGSRVVVTEARYMFPKELVGKVGEVTGIYGPDGSGRTIRYDDVDRGGAMTVEYIRSADDVATTSPAATPPAATPPAATPPAATPPAATPPAATTSPATTPPGPRFAVGDRVKVARGHEVFAVGERHLVPLNSSVGREATITAIHPRGDRVNAILRFDDETQDFCDTQYLDAVPPTPAATPSDPRFKIGDRVKVARDVEYGFKTGRYMGIVGTITEVLPPDSDDGIPVYTLTFDDDSPVGFPEPSIFAWPETALDALTPTPAPTVATSSRRFRVVRPDSGSMARGVRVGDVAEFARDGYSSVFVRLKKLPHWTDRGCQCPYCSDGQIAFYWSEVEEITDAAPPAATSPAPDVATTSHDEDDGLEKIRDAVHDAIDEASPATILAVASALCVKVEKRTTYHVAS